MSPPPPTPPSLHGLRCLVLSGNDLRAPPSQAPPPASAAAGWDDEYEEEGERRGRGGFGLFNGISALAGGASRMPPAGDDEAAALASVEALQRVLTYATDLRHLHLVDCNLDGEALTAILEGLAAGGAPLEELDISGNPDALLRCDPPTLRGFLEGTRRSLTLLRAHGAKLEGAFLGGCGCVAPYLIQRLILTRHTTQHN